MFTFKYLLTPKFIKHVYQSFKKNHSIIRLIHNYFLKDISIKGKTIDLGSGDGSNLSYYEHINLTKALLEKSDFFKQSDKKIDLENNLKINNEIYDNVILFNTLEHIRQYENLISEISRITKKNGKLEIFVPFLVNYHPDPKDFFRPTHFYLKNILEKNGFEVKINLIGVGPFIVSYQNLYKYLKFSFLKTIFFIFFDIFNKILEIFSKDHWKYYCGTHASCIKK